MKTAVWELLRAARSALGVATDYVTQHKLTGRVADFLRKGREWALWQRGKGPLVLLLGLLSVGCQLTTWWPWGKPIIPVPATPPPTTTTTTTTTTTLLPVPTPTPVSTPTPVPVEVCPPEVPPLAQVTVKCARLARTVCDSTPRVCNRAWCVAQGRQQDCCPFWTDESDLRLVCERDRAFPLRWRFNGRWCEGDNPECFPHPDPTKVFLLRNAQGTVEVFAKDDVRGVAVLP